MSRSNPHEGQPNPSTRWHEWNGETGTVKYYDRDTKQTVAVPDFQFLVLDQLGSVRGWHKLSDSGIYSNEVRDTRKDVLVVKSFKGGILAEGVYAAIKDAIKAKGGKFTANIYCAYKRDGELQIGSLQLKGGALGAWMEFAKAHRGEINKKAVKITGYSEGKTGKVVFRMPTFALVDVSDATNKIATALDVELQVFLAGYLKRTTRDQVETAQHVDAEDLAPPHTDDDIGPITDDDIPW